MECLRGGLSPQIGKYECRRERVNVCSMSVSYSQGVRGKGVPADSLPTMNVRGKERSAAGAIKAARAAVRNFRRDMTQVLASQDTQLLY